MQTDTKFQNPIIIIDIEVKNSFFFFLKRGKVWYLNKAMCRK